MKKCKICGKKDNEVKSIPRHGIYGSLFKWHYHEMCVKDAIRNPEKWGNKAVDTAIEITDCIESENIKIREEREKIEIYQKIWRRWSPEE